MGQITVSGSGIWISLPQSVYDRRFRGMRGEGKGSTERIGHIVATGWRSGLPGGTHNNDEWEYCKVNLGPRLQKQHAMSEHGGSGLSGTYGELFSGGRALPICCKRRQPCTFLPRPPQPLSFRVFYFHIRVHWGTMTVINPCCCRHISGTESRTRTRF
jgi:hypothetical protein